MSSGQVQVPLYPTRSPLPTRLIAINRVLSVIAGRKPRSAPLLPSTTDRPYNRPPVRTQSPRAAGHPSTAAELDSERGPLNGTVARAKRAICAGVCAPSKTSESEKCVSRAISGSMPAIAASCACTGVTANSPELLSRLVLAGAGIAAVPDYFAVLDPQHRVLRRLLPDWSIAGQTVSAVFPGRKLMPSKTRVFIDMLQAAFGADGG